MKNAETVKKRNTPKYLSYRWAVPRMKAAQDAGFFLETIAIAESILSDRIWSHVKGVTGGPALARDATLGKILAYQGTFKRNAPQELFDRVKAWAESRNKLMHGIVKSPPGTSPMSIQAFSALSADVASEALTLVPAVSAWHKRQLRAHRAIVDSR